MEIRHKLVDGRLILDILEFEIALDQAGALKRTILAEATARAARIVIVNCDKLGLIDSAGIGALIGVRNQLRRTGGRLLLCNLSPRVAAAVRRVTLDTIFEVYPDESAALRAFAP